MGKDSSVWNIKATEHVCFTVNSFTASQTIEQKKGWLLRGRTHFLSKCAVRRIEGSGGEGGGRFLAIFSFFLVLRSIFLKVRT